VGDTTSLVPGFPIRTSSDQRSVDSSPRLIAASYVLHRLPMPRHPPCALTHLQHKTPKNEIRKNCTSTHTGHPEKRGAPAHQMLATTIHKSNTTPHHQSEATTNLSTGRRRTTGLLSQSPIVCLMIPSPAGSHRPHNRENVCRAPNPAPLQQPGPSRPHPPQRDVLSWCSLERR
jgi:hypothetical protein